MSLYDRILGHPFVYNRVRPLVVGGIDMSPVYGRLAPGPSDVVLDLGCGTGDALNYLSGFERYLGVDVDDVAIRFARERHGSREGVAFDRKMLDEGDVRALAPTHVVMAGLLHHLTDDQAVSLLRMVQASSRLRRIVTQDIVYLPGELVNNAFARLDRGKYCRVESGYRALVSRAGLTLADSAIIRSHPTTGRTKYLVMTLTPPLG